MSKGEFTGDAKKSESNFWDEVNDLPDTVNPVESNANNPPGSSKNEDTVDVNVPGKYTGPVPRLWHHRASSSKRARVETADQEEDTAFDYDEDSDHEGMSSGEESELDHLLANESKNERLVLELSDGEEGDSGALDDEAGATGRPVPPPAAAPVPGPSCSQAVSAAARRPIRAATFYVAAAARRGPRVQPVTIRGDVVFTDRDAKKIKKFCNGTVTEIAGSDSNLSQDGSSKSASFLQPLNSWERQTRESLGCTGAVQGPQGIASFKGISSVNIIKNSL
ncbi:hypothetical protein ACROYT_G016053 [Oculina patagonica]